MSTVKEILAAKKQSQVWTIKESDNVFNAIKIMSTKNIGALIVMSDRDYPVGIVTERDYARKVLLKNRSSMLTQVHEIMESISVYVNQRQTAEDCMKLMTENKVRHLAVLDHGELEGIISMGDIVQHLILDREFLIDQFVYYINGSQDVDTSSIYCSSYRTQKEFPNRNHN